MRIEQLERRRLLAVTLSNGEVSIIGSGAVDNLQINNAPAPTDFIVKLNADSFTFAKAGVTSIKASLLGGNDIADIASAFMAVHIDGGADNDDLRGSLFGDTMLGGAGLDYLQGRLGADHLDGGADNDTIAVVPGLNTLLGGDGNDIIYGDSDDDVIDGGIGADNISGSTGNDSINGGPGNDEITGNNGDDTIDGGTGADRILGNQDNDTVTYASRTANLVIELQPIGTVGGSSDGEAGENDELVNDIENVIGGSGNDKITGSVAPAILNSSLNNRFEGGGGNDSLFGVDGDDVLNGGAGKDSLVGGIGSDTADYSERSSAVTIKFDGVANDGAPGENDVIAADVENATGGGGNDSITGDGGVNILDGGGGDDLLDGGLGADQLFGGGGSKDTATYANRAAAVNVSIDNTANDGQAAEGDNVKTDVENVIGGSGGDTIIGSSSANTLTGGPGMDNLQGGGGDDMFFVREGEQDTVDGVRADDRAQTDTPAIDTVTNVEHFQNSSIAGNFFNDLNSNGTKEAGETNLNNWTVYLDANNNNVMDGGDTSSTSDASGNYLLINVMDGNNAVRQVNKSGYRRSQPIPPSNFHSVNIPTGQAATNVLAKNFGDTQNILIGGTVFNDANSNGAKDAGEAGIAGVVVKITSNNTTVAQRTTDANGAWQVKGLIAGTGSAEITIPATYTATQPANAKYTGSMTAGQQNANLNFGLHKIGTAPLPAQAANRSENEIDSLLNFILAEL